MQVTRYFNIAYESPRYIEVVWDRGYRLHYVKEVAEEKPRIESLPLKAAGI